MNMRYFKFVAAGVLTFAMVAAASAQMMNGPGAATASQAQPMRMRFPQMQQMVDRAHQAKDWNERMRLMQSHMLMMQQEMGNMMGMMGMSARPGQRMGNGGMRGRQGQGTRGNMMGGNANGANDMQALQARMDAMQARMREMARMMQQMMEQQQLMLQKAAGTEKNGD